MEKTCWHVFFWMFFHVFPSSSGTWWTSPWGHRDRRALHGCHSWGSNSMVHQQPPASQTLFPTYRNSQKVGKETSCSRNSLTRTRITRGVHVVWKKKVWNIDIFSDPCLAPSDPRWPLLVINPWGFGGLWNCQLVEKYREINSKLELKGYRHRLFSSEIIGGNEFLNEQKSTSTESTAKTSWEVNQ